MKWQFWKKASVPQSAADKLEQGVLQGLDDLEKEIVEKGLKMIALQHEIAAAEAQKAYLDDWLINNGTEETYVPTEKGIATLEAALQDMVAKTEEEQDAERGLKGPRVEFTTGL